ncbi:tetratricopeptide repeat protein [Frigoriglobus tundricola]
MGTTLPVLMFYGVGGVGKSWLLRKLKAELAEDRPFLPTALLDSDPLSGGTAYHTDSSKALAHIRQQFKDVLCPRFDLAYAWLRYKEGITEEPLLKGSGPAADAFEVVKSVGGALAGVPGVGHGLKKIGDAIKKHVFKKSRLEKWLAETTGQEDFLKLRSADPQQLYPELADRFLRDLAENLQPQDRYACRAVIFIDTFEALSRGVQGRAQLHERQSWVRDLHAADSPVLLVLAGRDQLPWDELEAAYADPKYLKQTLVGLSEPDSREFLGKEGVADPAVQKAVLRVSEDTRSGPQGAERGYHPLCLYLCAKTIVNDVAAGRAVDPSLFNMKPGDLGELAQRFLKSLPDPAQEVWVRRLALAPRFDESAARTAFSATPGAPQDAAWHVLRGYSFLQETDEDGWWTLHAKMRHALATGAEVETYHRDWQEYWHERAKSDVDASAALAWYHGWRLNPSDGLREWNALAESLRKARRMADHQEVLDWWEPTGLLRAGAKSADDAGVLNDIGIEYTKISLGNRSAHLQRAIACYEAALRVHTEAEFPQDWAMTQNNLGTAHQNLPTGDRGENVRRAIACYESALRVYTEAEFPQDWATTQNNLGNAYCNLPTGDRDENLRNAIACYELALRVRTEAEFPQQWAMTQNNLGNAYSDLPTGDRGENLRRAIACYELALRVRTEAEFPQQWAMTQNNLGTAYWNLPTGDRGENLRNAIACYELALRVYTEADFPQDWAMTQFNRGLALVALAETAATPSHLQTALEAFQFTERGYKAVGVESLVLRSRKQIERVQGMLQATASDRTGAET